jgi:hypothetical protein
MAGCDTSGLGASSRGKRETVDLHGISPLEERRLLVVRIFTRWLVGHQQLDDHLAGRAGSLVLRIHHHALGRFADARGCKHPLALDLHHAGAAVAVGPVAGLVAPAQMRNGRTFPLGHLPDGFAVARLDFLAVEFELYCLA